MATAYWFKHDNNARTSVKIKSAARELAQLKGIDLSTALSITYADYFRLLEIMDSESDFIDLSNAFIAEEIANELMISSEELNKRVEVYTNQDLFKQSYLKETGKLGTDGFALRKIEALKRNKGVGEQIKQKWEQNLLEITGKNM